VEPPPLRRQSRPDRRRLYAIAGCLLAVLPALVVAVPPITDLPQQLAQVPLAGEVLTGAAPGYRVQWLTPNKLSYPLLALAWLTLPPLAAARLATALVAVLWVAAIHWLAARRRRPLAAAALAGLLAFNHVFYLGLFNFVVGLAVFAAWFEALDRDRRGEGTFARTALVLGVGGLLLYLAHALWLAAGLIWLAVVTLWDRRPPRWQLAAATGLVPTLLLVLLWYPSLAGAGWGSISSYGAPAISRLSFAWMTNATFGGVTGWLEPATMLILFAWVGTAVWQHRRDLAETVDRRLLAAAILFMLAALLLPDKIDRTLRFASRWMPVGWALLLLALPAPALRPAARRSLAAAVCALFCVVTATSWRGFDRHELTGLVPALASLPPAPTLLGLDYVRTSPRLKNPAYMHLPAYAQLLHGGRLNFSFVSLASSLVVKRDLATPEPWTQGLEWAPQLLRRSDFEHFGFALLHAPPEVVSSLQQQDDRLLPMTPAAPWRLFRIQPETAVPYSPAR
jgi:hypothetical protein